MFWRKLSPWRWEREGSGGQEETLLRRRDGQPGHPFYKRLNETLDAAGFDGFCEERCRTFYHDRLGRPSLAPGVYFRLQLIGFFEGVNSERGIAWRVADSLSLRRFLGYGLDEATPDHVTISRTGRRTHQRVRVGVGTTHPPCATSVSRSNGASDASP